MPGLEETLGLLLDMAVAVHSRCAASTAALLDMLDRGGSSAVSGPHKPVPVCLPTLMSCSLVSLKPVQLFWPVKAILVETAASGNALLKHTWCCWEL